MVARQIDAPEAILSDIGVDLGDLLRFAQITVYGRNFGSQVCSSIMSKDPVSVQFCDMPDKSWALMRERRIEALPVIDRFRRLLGTTLS